MKRRQTPKHKKPRKNLVTYDRKAHAIIYNLRDDPENSRFLKHPEPGDLKEDSNGKK